MSIDEEALRRAREGLELPEDEIPTPPQVANNLADLVRRDYSEIANRQEVHIPVVGYSSSGLSIKYHLPDSGKQLEAIAKSVHRQTKDTFARNLLIAIDTMLFLHDGLYVQPAGRDQPIPFDVDGSGIALTFADNELVELLGWHEVETTRDAVKRLFDGNEVAIMNHAEKLGRWMSDTTTDVDKEFWSLGE